MNSPTRRRGGRANVNAPGRRPVGRPPQRRPGKQLAWQQGPSIDIPADVVGIVICQLGGIHGVPSQDPLTETGGKTLYLPFDCFSHIFFRSVGYMTITPCRMFACRCARSIADAWLGKLNKGLLWMPPLPNSRFGGGNFLERSAQMHRSRSDERRVGKECVSTGRSRW